MEYEEKNDLGEMGLKSSNSKQVSSVKEEVYVESFHREDDSTTTTTTFSCSFSSSLSSSQDLEEDASSSSSGSSHSERGPLYELDDLMAQLPIKRGLSKYYNGKSQTFTSLADVKSVEDLAKEDKFSGYNRRMKSCKSFGGSLSLKRDRYHHHKLGPKAIINKEICKKSSISPSLAASNKLWIL